MKEIKKICIECGKEFVTGNAKLKTCSDECRIERRRRLAAISNGIHRGSCYEYIRQAEKRHKKSSSALTEIVKKAFEERAADGRPLSYGQYVAMYKE